MELFFDNRQNLIKIDEELLKTIEKAIAYCLLKEDLTNELEISISFVNNLEIKELNRTYRNQDKETDVLSFPQYDNIQNAKNITCLGDIVLSLEKAEEQAKEYDHSFQREVVYLTVHSMLHLMGYDHDDDLNTGRMRQKEEEIMVDLGILR